MKLLLIICIMALFVSPASAQEAREVVVEEVTEVVKDTAQGVSKEAADGVKNSVQGATDAVKGSAQEVSDAVKGSAQEASDAIKGSAQEVTDTVKGSAQEVTDTVKGSAQEVTDTVKGSAQEVTDTIKGSAQEVTGAIKESAQEITDAVKGSVKEVTDTVKETVDQSRAVVTDTLNQVKTARDDVLGAVDNVKSSLLKEKDALQAEIAALNEKVQQAKYEARRELIEGARMFRWLFELSPNIDGSLAFGVGGEYKYLEQFLVGLTYNQVQRIIRDECDTFSTRSCTSYAEVVDRQISLQGFGYEMPLGDHWQLSFHMNGMFFLQDTEGTSVDIGLDRYVSSRGAFTSLQLNTQLEIDWRPSPHVFLHLGGSASPLHVSAEREEGYDSGLISRMPDGDTPLGNDNNVIYTGQLGNYTEYFYNESVYFDGLLSLYIIDLLGSSDAELSVSARYLSYGATAQRSVIFNGELKNEESSQDFSKLDLFAKLAFELSFLGFTPSNPMVGLTYTRSTLAGLNQATESQSFGFVVSFATPPALSRSRSPSTSSAQDESTPTSP